MPLPGHAADLGAAYLSTFANGDRSIFDADLRERRELRNRLMAMVDQNSCDWPEPHGDGRR